MVLPPPSGLLLSVVTEFTSMVCSSDAGRFGCFEASSAIDATTTTPRW